MNKRETERIQLAKDILKDLIDLWDIIKNKAIAKQIWIWEQYLSNIINWRDYFWIVLADKIIEAFTPTNTKNLRNAVNNSFNK